MQKQTEVQKGTIIKMVQSPLSIKADNVGTTPKYKTVTRVGLGVENDRNKPKESVLRGY